MNGDNPAARLHAILVKAKAKPNNQNCRVAWSEILNISSKNESKFLMHMGKVTSLSHEIFEFVKNEYNGLLLEVKKRLFRGDNYYWPMSKNHNQDTFDKENYINNKSFFNCSFSLGLFFDIKSKKSTKLVLPLTKSK